MNNPVSFILFSVECLFELALSYKPYISFVCLFIFKKMKVSI
ncbi:hypothetical protein PRUB_b1466 [Pseudoalteromonas rubra]|uniref:Uncharacterized protein n=1 Tax=Pseudoalteromonas rubra TaxID=43658 RepID=A0A8T0C4B1_9GAMM|nr:hypothetical protein PRUB_b1466 [Pseudoalteromonas rubra]